MENNGSTVAGSRSSYVYPLDCAPLDIALGNGGVRSGKIYEVRGGESLGKSTIALACAVAFCDYWISRGVTNIEVRWVETESAFDWDRLLNMRPDLGKYFFADEIETVEGAHEYIHNHLMRCASEGKKMFLAWDTYAAAETEAQMEALDDGESSKEAMHAGGQMEKPRILRQLFRSITLLLGRTDCPFLFVNQTYKSKLGKFQVIDESYGGGAIKYHASVRIDLTKGPDIEEVRPDGSTYSVGILTNAYTMKSKVSMPHQTIQIAINNEGGLDKLETCLQFMKTAKMLNGAAWKSFQYPVRAFNPKEDGKGKTAYVPEMAECKFQNTKQLREYIEVKAPHLLEWMNYLIYLHFTQTSALTKLRVVDHLWQVEEKYYGVRKTELTEREKIVAKAIEDKLREEAAREDQSHEKDDAPVVRISRSKAKSGDEERPAKGKKKARG